MVNTIVVGVDGSEAAGRAVRWCSEHAVELNSTVVAVFAVEVPVYAPGPLGIAAMPPSPTVEERADLRDTVARDWCKPLADAGVEHRVVVEDGSPAAVIKAVADRVDAQLVVVGRRGYGGFAEVVLGSTSHQLAHHVGRPLVIVP